MRVDGAALLAALLAAGVGALVAVLLERRRVRRVAREVGRWRAATAFAPLASPGGGAWRELAVSLNALGASHARRGERIAREAPWRVALVEALAPPVLLFGPDGHLEAANAPARDLLAIPRDPVDPTALQALGSAALADAVARSRELGRPVTLDVARGDQELRATVSPVDGATLVVLTDRTRERRVEELRRDFVVNASHELKTPVTGIQTLAEALDITVRTDPERTLALLARLRGESERLARLVHDLLDLRRLEEDGPFARVPVDLAELVRRVAADLAPAAEAAGVTVRVGAPSSAVVVGVPDDLELAVRNLVDNAVQYNRRGGTVDVTVVAGDGTQSVRVVDSGIGIPHQDLPRVFERFYRVDAARSRETGGTGLGLSLVRHAAERHGGSVTVESLLGEGSTFVLTLPVGPGTGGVAAGAASR